MFCMKRSCLQHGVTCLRHAFAFTLAMSQCSCCLGTVQNEQLESNVLGPLRQWIQSYRAFKDRMKVLDNTRLDFDAERRAFSKLDIKRVRQQQAADKVEPELAGKLEAKGGDVAGMFTTLPHMLVPL